MIDDDVKVDDVKKYLLSRLDKTYWPSEWKDSFTKWLDYQLSGCLTPLRIKGQVKGNGRPD